jgi:hypothetical protein
LRDATSTSGVLGSKPPSFPVWKRGSIASEPDLVRLTTWSIPPPAPACPARRSSCAVGRTTCSNPTCGRRLTTSFRSIGSSASLCRFWFNLSRVPEKRDLPTAVFGFHSSLVWFDQSRPEVFLLKRSLIRVSGMIRDSRTLCVRAVRPVLRRPHLDAAKGVGGFREILVEADEGLTAFRLGQMQAIRKVHALPYPA